VEKELRAGQSSGWEHNLFPTEGSNRYKTGSVKALDEHRNNKSKKE
jgi:hypothetical protein